jgi:hypothetical protein
MINRTSLVVAVVLAGISATTVLADDFNDPFTGLPKGIYYGTLDDLHRQGLPMSKRAEDYMNQHHSSAESRGNVYLLEDRGAPARKHRKVAQ